MRKLVTFVGLIAMATLLSAYSSPKGCFDSVKSYSDVTKRIGSYTTTKTIYGSVTQSSVEWKNTCVSLHNQFVQYQQYPDCSYKAETCKPYYTGGKTFYRSYDTASSKTGNAYIGTCTDQSTGQTYSCWIFDPNPLTDQSSSDEDYIYEWDEYYPQDPSTSQDCRGPYQDMTTGYVFYTCKINESVKQYTRDVDDKCDVVKTFLGQGTPVNYQEPACTLVAGDAPNKCMTITYPNIDESQATKVETSFKGEVFFYDANDMHVFQATLTNQDEYVSAMNGNLPHWLGLNKNNKVVIVTDTK